MTVIIIDADFRRPTQYRYLDRPRSPNLGDLDITCTAADLDAVLQDTDVPGVRLAASAPNKADPGHSIAVAKAAGRVGQELADIVIIDSPPLLLANDASDIALERRRVDPARPLRLDAPLRDHRLGRPAAPPRGAGHRHRDRRRRARRARRLLRLLRLLRLRIRLRPPGRGLARVEAAPVEVGATGRSLPRSGGRLGRVTTRIGSQRPGRSGHRARPVLTIPGSDRPVGAVPAPDATRRSVDRPRDAARCGAPATSVSSCSGPDGADPLTLAGTGVACGTRWRSPCASHELVDRLAARFGAPTSARRGRPRAGRSTVCSPAACSRWSRDAPRCCARSSRSTLDADRPDDRAAGR